MTKDQQALLRLQKEVREAIAASDHERADKAIAAFLKPRIAKAFDALKADVLEML